jgi:hypothetical protein
VQAADIRRSWWGEGRRVVRCRCGCGVRCLGGGTDDASGDGSGSTLVLRWDGSRWSRVASPSPDHELTALWDVVGVSVADAWAVGYSGKGGLIEHWDGSAWSEVPVSLPDDFLQGIDAVTADDIWAVGAHGTTGRPRPVVVHWDGKSWREIATPGLPQGTPYGLSAVSAVAADDVWAVGAVITNPVTEASVPIVLHWDGSSWKVFGWTIWPAEHLDKVSAVAHTDVWVTGGRGFVGQNTDNEVPLVAHWDGERWSAVRPPGLSDAVSASGRAVWVAGADRSETEAAIARRVGTSWLHTRVDRSAGGWFVSISTLPTGNAWAVGYSDADGWPLAQQACAH